MYGVSRMTVTKLQVDVLVQAAMVGPMGAEHWTPLASDADELGRELLTSGRRSSGERNGEEYLFEPLPVGITAVEAIKACSYYRYQRAKAPAIVDRISDALLGHLDGMKEAPWGWTSEDVAARLGRPAPGSELPAPPPVDVIVASERLREIGVEVHSVTAAVSEAMARRAGGRGRVHGTIHGLHVEERTGLRYVTQIQILVAESASVAERLFPLAVSSIVWDRQSFTEVRRVGSLVTYANLPSADRWADPEAAEILDRLGSPEERWSVTEPPMETGAGEVLGRHVEMTLTSPAVATNRADLDKLLDCLTDVDLRDRLNRVDLTRHSVVAAPRLDVGVIDRWTWSAPRTEETSRRCPRTS